MKAFRAAPQEGAIASHVRRTLSTDYYASTCPLYHPCHGVSRQAKKALEAFRSISVRSVSNGRRSLENQRALREVSKGFLGHSNTFV
jgi:hypothetical protein